MLFKYLSNISTAALLFCLFFSVYSLFMSGWIQYGDEMEKYRVAQSIVEDHPLSIRPTAMRNNVGVGEQTYSIYELGQTFLQVPLYAIGKTFYSFFPVPDPNWITILLVGFLNPLLTTLSVLVFFTACGAIGFQQRTALALTYVFGLATIIFPYSKGFTREPLLTFLILSSVSASYSFNRTRNMRWLFVAGVASGYLIFTKTLQAVVAPLILGYTIFIIIQDSSRTHADSWRTLSATLKRASLFVLPNLVFFVLGAMFALVRYGTIFSGMSTLKANPIEYLLAVNAPSEPMVASIQLMISPVKSLFLYSLPVCLFLPGWFQWVRRNAADAILAILILGVDFLTVILRYDWDGGTWWGPRYLVQVIPLLVLPIGFLLETANSSARKVWWSILGVLSAIGLVIQLVGALTNDRDYADTMGIGTSLVGQLDFLRHGAIDSLVFNISPLGGLLQINTYGVLVIVIVAFLGCAIAWRARRHPPSNSSRRFDFSVVLFVFFAEFAAFVFWVVRPYPQVVAAKATTRLAAANQFLADGQVCQAAAYYLMALDRQTNYSELAARQIEQLWPRATGKRLAIHVAEEWIEAPEGTSFEEDSVSTLTGTYAVRFEASPRKDASVSITSQPVTVQPDEQYELSGWLKADSIYGTGYGVAAVFEDDGNWSNGRTSDMASLDETHGWQPFRRSLITLPTTKRLFIKIGLYRTYGKFWVDGLQLVQVDPSAPRSVVTGPPCSN